jgi:hypothetical protein
MKSGLGCMPRVPFLLLTHVDEHGPVTQKVLGLDRADTRVGGSEQPG